MVNSELMLVDVAIEIIAEMIGDVILALKDEKNQEKINELNKKLKLYYKQRDEVYSRKKETIEYVLNVYGSKLKSER